MMRKIRDMSANTRERNAKRLALAVLLGCIAFVLLVDVPYNILVLGPFILMFARLVGPDNPVFLFFVLVYGFGAVIGAFIGPFLVAVTLYRKFRWEIRSPFLSGFLVTAILLMLSIGFEVTLLPPSMYGDFAKLRQDFIFVLIMGYFAAMQYCIPKIRGKMGIPPATMRYIFIATLSAYFVVMGVSLVAFMDK